MRVRKPKELHPFQKKRIADELADENRRRMVLKLRMAWPPHNMAQIAKKLGVSCSTVKKDLEYIRTQLGSEYFAENNRAAVARACAELEVVAFMIMADMEKIPNTVPLLADKRAAYYGRMLQALAQRNSLLADTGIIKKVPVSIEHGGPNGGPIPLSNIPVTMSVEDRIAALTAARGVGPSPATPPANE